MKFTRRHWMVGAAAVPFAAETEAAARLPLKSEFPVVKSEICLNNARWHPISTGAIRAVQQYLDYKTTGGGADPNYGTNLQVQAKSLFAQMIGAKTTEISFVPSTLAGENLIVSALGLPAAGGNVVTDALHFEGSLYLYEALQKQGLDLRVVRPRDWRIHLSDIEKALNTKTKLVAVSQVSMLNGFEHDLKALCDLAHSHGAYVFADIVQAAGAVPIDVRASGVDFCSCASYKWLMGDMGLGFLYVREELLERLKRPQYGYRQLSKMDYHMFPYEPPSDRLFEWEQTHDAGGHFEVGTISNTTVAALTYSLELIQKLGVANIQSYRQPLLDKLQKELPRFGMEALTPQGSRSPIVSFAVKDTTRMAHKLRQANIDIAVYPHRIRVSPSVYNDEHDIDKLLEVLSA